MTEKSREILARMIALVHGLLTAYIIVVTIWFLVTFKLNVYVVVALVLAVWIMSVQKLIIGGCPLTFIENRLRGITSKEKFMVRFWRFFGIKIRQEEKTWRVLKWAVIGLFVAVLVVRLVLTCG